MLVLYYRYTLLYVPEYTRCSIVLLRQHSIQVGLMTFWVARAGFCYCPCDATLNEKRQTLQ